MNYKQDKNSMLIQKYISDIIQYQVKKDIGGMPTVTHCEVTNDYSYAKVYISFLGLGNKEKYLDEIKRCKGFIRSELAKKIKLYKVPDLIFLLDDSYDKGQHIEDIIKKIHEEDAKRNK